MSAYSNVWFTQIPAEFLFHSAGVLTLDTFDILQKKNSPRLHLTYGNVEETRVKPSLKEHIEEEHKGKYGRKEE